MNENKPKFDPDVEMANVKEELNELIANNEGKDKEMYQELLDFVHFVEEQKNDIS